MFVSQRSTNEEYADTMRAILLRYKALGVEHAVYGDIFLEDLRRWREDNLAQLGMTGEFPLWKNDTKQLMAEFVALGFRAVLCCTNDPISARRTWAAKLDANFVADLPPDVDPCGEEWGVPFFVYAGPIFRAPLSIRVGEKVYRPIEQTHPGASVCSTTSWCCIRCGRLLRGFGFAI